ncbi:MAG: radical SAM protein [Endomicrobiales bacterium]|nr:radical SAM protein [Endomicrobiales bacterium]
MKKKLLLINPPIYDFAAYDLWLRPLGLLYIGAILKNAGLQTKLIDCLDRNHPEAPKNRSDNWGCGKFYSLEVPKPEVLKDVPRVWKRYGLPGEALKKEIEKARPFDAALVTSVMTYWYPGVFEVVRVLKSAEPGVPVLLGGNYATLCLDHAKANSGADHVLPGNSLKGLYGLLEDLGVLDKNSYRPGAFADFPAPAYDGYRNPGHAAIRMSYGCPFRCTYCASSYICGGEITLKDPEKVASEIDMLGRTGVKNIAFYDDALLYNPEGSIDEVLERVIKKKTDVFFHTPNGLNARFLSGKTARLMKQTGFVMPRISLETADSKKQAKTGGKVESGEFLTACGYLREAGYEKGEFAAYMMIGTPGQGFYEAEKSAWFAHEAGAKVSLSEYSPIPHTADWEKVQEQLPSDDPLWHNNSAYPLFSVGEWEKIREIKKLAVELNGRLKKKGGDKREREAGCFT